MHPRDDAEWHYGPLLSPNDISVSSNPMSVNILSFPGVSEKEFCVYEHFYCLHLIYPFYLVYFSEFNLLEKPARINVYIK